MRWLAAFGSDHGDRAWLLMEYQRSRSSYTTARTHMFEQQYPGIGAPGNVSTNSSVGASIQRHVNCCGTTPEINAALVHELGHCIDELRECRHSGSQNVFAKMWSISKYLVAIHVAANVRSYRVRDRDVDNEERCVEVQARSHLLGAVAALPAQAETLSADPLR